jgi:DNA-binding CsgD family transcriptional regulator
MITTDCEGRIVAWSPAAQRLLGFRPEQMLGRSFFDAVGARDIFGNRLCGQACCFQAMVRDGEPVRTFEMRVQTAAGALVSTFVSIDSAGGRRLSGRLVYHLRADLRGQDRRRDADRRRARGLEVQAERSAAGERNPWGLTSREIEVLRCLARGSNTATIAVELGISPTTVRNHVQRLLRKLGVHGRLEALTVAFRHQVV